MNRYEAELAHLAALAAKGAQVTRAMETGQPNGAITPALEGSQEAADDEEVVFEPPALPNAPELSDKALHGIVGDIVRFLEPTTEAHRAGLLTSLLNAVGNILGREVHAIAGNSRHHPNLFAVLVGPTGEGRKGTSWDAVRPVLELAAPEWFKANIKSGLSSGEGLIWAVRDPIEKLERVSQGKGQPPSYESVLVDSGIDDKRLLVLEGEFAQALTVIAREGNTLGVVMRNGWDGVNLSILTKASAAQATEPHISILGHITGEELHTKLTSTDAHNGVGNRILWVYVRRARILPFTPQPDADTLAQLAGDLKLRLQAAQGLGEIAWTEGAARAWERVYPKLTAARSGLIGSLTARAAPQVIRLAMLYAVLDTSPRIALEHLKAALAIWEYSEASVEYIFKARSGDPIKARVQQLLEAAGAGMTRSSLGDALGKHVRSSDLELVLAALEQERVLRRVLIRPAQGSKGGRPREVFRMVDHAEKPE